MVDPFDDPIMVTALVDPKDLEVVTLAHYEGEFVGDFSDIMEWGRYRTALTTMALKNDPDAFNKLNTWRKDMAHRIFTIELKMDLDNTDERYEPMKRILAVKAMELQASAMLLTGGDKKPPEIVMFTEDQFFTVEDINPLSEEQLNNGEGDLSAIVGAVTSEGNDDVTTSSD